MIQSIGFTLRLITLLLLIAPGFMQLAHAEPVADPEGSSWNFAFDGHRIQFEHDGSGLMRMRINERSAWNLLQAS